MGYKREKEKAEKKFRRVRAAAAIVLACALAGLCVFSAFYPPSTWKYYVRLPEISARGEGELRIHFLDVGQGDCTLLELPDGRSMLIDGGNGSEESTSAILRYLNALEIDRLDFLLLTHSDSDHCGGIAEVLRRKGADRFYAPGIENPAAVGDAYAAFYAALSEAKGTEAIVSRRYLQINSLSEAFPYTLTFLSPYRAGNPESPYDKINSGEYTDADLNDSSAVVWLDYCGTSALFCGDASAEVERRLMSEYRVGLFDDCGVALDDTEILKVSHHGSATGTCEEFVGFLGVETAVISCGANNLYGHPAPEVCSRLAAAGARCFRTDSDGSVVVTVSFGGGYTAEPLSR